MSLPRVALVVLVIGTAITASYFIAINPIKINSKPQAMAVNKPTQPPDPQPNLLSTKTPLEVTSEDSITHIPAQEPVVLTPQNLTEQIISTISDYLVGQIITENTNGPTMGENGKSGIAIPGEQEISNFLNENIGTIENGPLPQDRGVPTYHPGVYETKLTIISGGSKSAQIEYIRALIWIAQNHSSTITKTDEEILGALMNENNPIPAQQLANMYGTVAHEYTKLAIPATWEKAHKEILSYYFTAQSIWADIANYKNDPIQALAAIEALDMLSVATKGIPQMIVDGMKRAGIHTSDLNT